jgi:hypothetical protein
MLTASRHVQCLPRLLQLRQHSNNRMQPASKPSPHRQVLDPTPARKVHTSSSNSISNRIINANVPALVLQVSASHTF